MKYKITRETEKIFNYVLINLFLTVFLILIMYRIHEFNVFSILNMHWLYFTASIISFFISLILHELTHILFFKIFGKGKAKISVRISFQEIFIEQTNRNLAYTRNQMVFILISPFLLIFILCILLSIVFPEYYLIFYIVCIANSLASMIDVGLTFRLLRFNKNSKILYYFEN